MSVRRPCWSRQAFLSASAAANCAGGLTPIVMPGADCSKRAADGLREGERE